MTTAKRMSKAQVFAELADQTGLSKKEIQSVFDGIAAIMERELGSQGPGEFIMPDIVKLKVRHVPAREEHVGVDPFTKEEKTFPAKPASRKVKATPLKKLKDLIS